jgi:hypothetical protein
MAEHKDVGEVPTNNTGSALMPQMESADEGGNGGHTEQIPPSATSNNLSSDPEQVAQLKQSQVTENYVYAVGVLKPVFPNKGLQEAFYSAARTLKVSEHDYYSVLSYIDPANHFRPYLYIAEQIEWVLTIHDIDSYILLPRAKAELLCFIDGLKPAENSLLTVQSTAIGVLVDGVTSQALSLPKVICNHLFSQTLDSLHEALKSETGVTTSVIQDVLKGLEYQPNNGRGNFSRAKNYLAYRYPEIYLTTHALKNVSNANEVGFFLNDVKASYSDLASPHVIVDLIFNYKSKSSKREKYYHCSVDVTHQFPFVNAPLQAYMPFTQMAG